MSGEVTSDQLHDATDKLRAHLDDRLDEIHRTINDTASKIFTKLDEHVKDDRVLENRITIIETERKVEATQAAKQSTVIALLVSAGLTGAWHLVERIWK